VADRRPGAGCAMSHAHAKKYRYPVPVREPLRLRAYSVPLPPGLYTCCVILYAPFCKEAKLSCTHMGHTHTLSQLKKRAIIEVLKESPRNNLYALHRFSSLSVWGGLWSTNIRHYIHRWDVGIMYYSSIIESMPVT
jgi:hypothetical protein